MNRVKNLDSLNDREKQELRDLRNRYMKARSGKDYATSDRVRVEMEARGCHGPEYDSWHPVFETTEQRRIRATARYLYDERK